MKKKETAVIEGGKAQNGKKPPYIRPVITTYTKDEIVEMIGPALACVSDPGCPASP